MSEIWKVFKNRDTGQELLAYTMSGTFTGEEEASKEQLAAEHGIDVGQIETVLELR